MIYGYIRVSTDRQTVENQRYEIKRFCQENNLQVDKWISETISGVKEVDKRRLGKLLKGVRRRHPSESARFQTTDGTGMGCKDKGIIITPNMKTSWNIRIF